MSTRKYRYYGKTREECRMRPETVGFLKAVFYSVLMGIPVVIALFEPGAKPTVLVVVYIVAVLLAIGIEIEHIKFGDALFVQFSNGREDGDDEDGDG